jgi:hypothetical protein
VPVVALPTVEGLPGDDIIVVVELGEDEIIVGPVILDVAGSMTLDAVGA